MADPPQTPRIRGRGGSLAASSGQKKGRRFRLNRYAASASGGVKGSPRASATGRQVSLPACTFNPLRRCGSSAMALRQPLSANAKAKGRVALFSAKVEVRATAPGMLVTQY